MGVSSDRSKRRHHNDRIIRKRLRQSKELKCSPKSPSHKFAKTNPMTCGDSKCVMCGNPRKFFNEPTLQEKRFFQEDE